MALSVRGPETPFANGGRFGAISDQCSWYSAPCSIQRRTRSSCAGEIALPAEAGGMRFSGSSAVKRL
jgi:hypothetical protein